MGASNSKNESVPCVPSAEPTESVCVVASLNVAVSDTVPTAPTNENPADGATDQSLTPTFSWDAASAGHSYLVQVATDAAFTNIVLSHETTDTAWTPDSGDSLDSSARYWWRVVARNACGDSAAGVEPPPPDRLFADGFDPPAAIVAGQEFTTLAMPGDCPVDSAPTTVFSDDMENGAGGWTHAAASGSTDTWTLGSAAHGGSFAWQADAPAAGAANDQWLISPSMALPADLSTLSLKFWNQQHIKASTSGCYDGALIEVSGDGGSTWTQITDGLLTDPYDGSISGGFGNPLAGAQGWCGDPQAYLDSIVDIQAWAGQTVKFRFNLGHDRLAHRTDPNWAIDDVKVTGCTQ